ncbi:8240_t:CDS:1 [Ambispora leptoticha]|uniref:Pre-mRNA-splicing factor SYF2 n=1 Tax=Ambispora leptoticha TaxID=144679 RepID=A0A9N9BBF8_9GLOM|nr:8240_t:CDS:1 [Ambispora leptoticha]
MADALKARLEKLAELRKLKDEAIQENRKELYAEHQRSKTNPREETKRERKRNEAEKLLARQEAEKKGEDWQRKNFWDISIEDAEKWEEKQEKKASRANTGFTDYNQVAQKKYERLINEFKPNLTAYKEQKAAALASASLVTTEDGKNVASVDVEGNFFRDANSLSYATVDQTPSREAVDRVVQDVHKQIIQRENYSRKRAARDDDDITYINERNRRFNEKISRFYDAYTREIRENFERGTAL